MKCPWRWQAWLDIHFTFHSKKAFKSHPQNFTHRELSDRVGTADTHLSANCHWLPAMQVPATDLPDQCLEWVAKGGDMVGTLWGNNLGSPEDRTHTPICGLFCRGTPEYMHSWTCSSLQCYKTLLQCHTGCQLSWMMMMDKTIQLTCQNPKPRHQGICGGSNTTIRSCGILNMVVLTHFMHHITVTSLVIMMMMMMMMKKKKKSRRRRGKKGEWKQWWKTEWRDQVRVNVQNRTENRQENTCGGKQGRVEGVLL